MSGEFWYREDAAVTHKWNHRHADGTTVAHDFGEGCVEPVTRMAKGAATCGHCGMRCPLCLNWRKVAVQIPVFLEPAF